VPELPEVETIVRDLARLLPGAKIRDVEVLRPDLIEGQTADEFAKELKGAEIRGVTRRAKNIVFDLGARPLLLVNLGMTGRLLVPKKDDPPQTHLGVRMGLADGRELLYNDSRRFGRLWRMTREEWAEWEATLGMEPLDDGFTAEFIHGLAQRSRVAVKTWLMDQKRIVGVGNIYASEAMFRAGLDPRRPANTVTLEEAARLRDGIRDVLTEAIEFRGTTFLDYRDAAGEKGEFAGRLRMYDRAGEACPGCGGKIEKIVQGGRSTFFCPACQH
jgi:formamidopyrimidine-DNA glycosylase